MGRIRLAVLDDGGFVRSEAGEIRPVAATFHLFVEAVARSGPFARTRYIVPVRSQRAGETLPPLAAVNQEVLEVVPTAPFGGIADYIVRSPLLALRNWRPIRRAVADSDLVWLRLPASNAPLALTAVRRHRVPYFSWLAGSVSAVAEAQQRPWPLKLAARAVGRAYDAVGRIAAHRAPAITLDAEMFASVVSGAEVEESRASAVPVRDQGPWRIAWVGRLGAEKGVVELVDAFGGLLEAGCDATLVLIGDGPGRAALERRVAELPAGRVEDHGYVADRFAYMRLLRGADLLVHPSRAEGVPKVLVEAMAAGVPIVAADAGAVAEVLDQGQRGELVHSGDAGALARAISRLLDDHERRTMLRQAGLDWAADHTIEAQAQRLVGWMREQFPQLKWVS